MENQSTSNLPVIEVQGVQGVHGYMDEKGMVNVLVDDVAVGLGLVQLKKDRVPKSGDKCNLLLDEDNIDCVYTVVRWERVNKYLRDLGCLGKNDPKIKSGDYIPEVWVYLLAMKANNETARAFQWKIAEEILPSIRKHGYYSLVSETKPVAEKPKKNQKRADAQNSPARVYVFLLVASSFFAVKIGLSKDLETRKKTVERETNATVCHIYKTSLLPRKIARLLEKLCKEYFSSSRLSGEYFFADYNEVCKVLNMLEKLVEALPSVIDHVRAEELLQIADTLGNTPERKNILIEAANIIAGKKVA